MSTQLTLEEYSYLREIIQAVAEGEQPKLRDKPLIHLTDPTPWELNDYYRRQSQGSAALCLAATAYFLNHTPIPHSLDFIEIMVERNRRSIQEDLETLRYLEERYQSSLFVALPPSYEEEKAKAAKNLTALFANPGWVSVDDFQPAPMGDTYFGRTQEVLAGWEGRRLDMTLGLMTGRFPTLSAASRHYGISPTRGRQIVLKQLRIWNNPSRYGLYFSIYPRSSRKPNCMQLSIVEFNDRYEDGDLAKTVYDAITLPEIYVHLQAFFKGLGLSMHVQTRVDE